MPKKIKFTKLLLDCTFLLWATWQLSQLARAELRLQPNGGESSSAVRYVSPTGNDTNSGSFSRPWATIQHADAVAKPGDTVVVLDGTYRGNVVLASSGTSGEPITYKAQNKWGAKLVGTGSGAGSAVIGVNGGYIVIQNFDITGSNANGIILAYSGSIASHNQAIGNYVHDMVVPCNSDSGTAIESGGGDDYSGISHNDMIGNLIVNITPYGGCPGGHQASGLFAETPYSVIADNIVINAGYGIQSWHAASNVAIVGNILVNNLRSITVGAGDSPYGRTNDYSLVQHNIVYNSASTAIAETGKTGSHNKYLDNLVYGGDISISLKSGLKATGTINADPKFVNNTGTADGNYALRADSPGRWKRLSLNEAMIAVGANLVTQTAIKAIVPAAGVSASVSTIGPGQSSVITWTTKNAVNATLNGAAVPLIGSIVVSPTVTTRYKVVAKSATGATDWGSATVSVHR